MKTPLPLLLAGLLALPIASYAGSEEFYTNIPAAGSVAGKLDFDGSADGGYTNVNVTNKASTTTSYGGVGGQFQGYFSVENQLLAENDNTSNLFFRFFCIDLYQPATEAVTIYYAKQYSNDSLRKLYDVAYPNEQLGDFFNGTKTNFGKFTNASGSSYTAQDYSTAFQLAVWEIFYETSNTHSLGDGTFFEEPYSDPTKTINSSALAIANEWLSQVDDYTSGTDYQNWHLYSFKSNSNQDYLSARYDVPEPGSLVLAGLGLAGLMATRRRRRNKA